MGAEHLLLGLGGVRLHPSKTATFADSDEGLPRVVS